MTEKMSENTNRKRGRDISKNVRRRHRILCTGVNDKQTTETKCKNKSTSLIYDSIVYLCVCVYARDRERIVCDYFSSKIHFKNVYLFFWLFHAYRVYAFFSMVQRKKYLDRLRWAKITHKTN